MAQGRILYARHEDVYVLKFVGGIHYGQNWTFDLSKALAAFLDRLFKEENFREIIIDLTEATAIDSTNLGLLARIAIFMQDKFGQKPLVVSTNPNVNHTLHTVGFRQIFNIVEKPIGTPDAELDLPGQERDVSVPKMLLVAHRTLCTLNDSNSERFKDLVETLEDHLAQEEKAK
jgi:anti-anti-sigma factor